MSLATYLCKGPSFSNGFLRREDFPEDKISINGNSSYSYEGNVLTLASGSIRILDGVATLRGVPKQTLRDARAAWQRLHNGCFFLTALNVANFGYCFFSAFFDHTLTYSSIAAITAAFAILSFIRMEEAFRERDKWFDPIENWKSLRKGCGTHFNRLHKWDLKGKLFTAQETQNIFIRCLAHSVQDLPFQPKEALLFMRDFFQNNVLTVSNLEYAFPIEPIVADPNRNIETAWDKQSLIQIAREVEKLVRKYNQIRSELENQISFVNQVETDRHLGVINTQIFSHSLDPSQKTTFALKHISLLAHRAINSHSNQQRGEIQINAERLFLREFMEPLVQIFHQIKRGSGNSN